VYVWLLTSLLRIIIGTFYSYEGTFSGDTLHFDSFVSHSSEHVEVWLLLQKLWLFSSHSYVFTGKIKLRNFDLKFGPYIGPTVLRISCKFQPKRMYLSRDIDFSSELTLGDLFVARDYFLKKSISRDRYILFG